MRWITALDEVAEGEACAWIVRLDGAAAERSAARPSPADLAHAAAARAADGGAARLWRRRLLRALAARWLGVHSDEVVFPAGEPRPARVVAPEPLFVSAASRGPWTVVAVGPGPLGVDVDLLGADIAALAVSRDASPDETLRFWTAAEAYAKATGCTLDLAWAACAGSRRRPACPLGPPRGQLPRAAISPKAEDGRGVEHLEAPGFPACAISHHPLGDLALAAAAEA